MRAIAIDDFKHALGAQAGCQAIDVRERGEFESEHIAGTRLTPLSQFAAVTELDAARPVYIVCRSGMRAQRAGRDLEARGFRDVVVVEGGVVAWRNAGLPLVYGERRVWALDRQVRFTAGSIVLAGLLLAAVVDRAWLALSGFIGAGLVFSAVTDTCAMGFLLARAPWNRGQKPRGGCVTGDVPTTL